MYFNSKLSKTIQSIHFENVFIHFFIIFQNICKKFKVQRSYFCKIARFLCNEAVIKNFVRVLVSVSMIWLDTSKQLEFK